MSPILHYVYGSAVQPLPILIVTQYIIILDPNKYELAFYQIIKKIEKNNNNKGTIGIRLIIYPWPSWTTPHRGVSCCMTICTAFLELFNPT